MAILNLDYYTQVDHYSDGDIEDQMLEMVKKGISYEKTCRRAGGFSCHLPFF